MARYFFALMLLSLYIFNCRVFPKHPVILVPGLGASRLWHKDDTDDYYSPLWIAPYKTVFDTASLVRDMKLKIDPITGATADRPGHTVKACGFGNPETLTDLTMSLNPLSFPKRSSSECDGEMSFYDDKYDLEGLNTTFADKLRNRGVNYGPRARRRRSISGSSIQSDNVYYFKTIVDTLKGRGYKVNKDIKGAPYDFRKAPNELTDFYLSLKQLVQNTYSRNTNCKVVMVAHSNGNPVLLHFYNNVVTTEWKDKYIRAHVALGPPWAGATKSLWAIVSGDSLDIPFTEGTDLRPMQRSWPTIAWLMPSPIHGLWQAEEDLIVTPYKRYGVNDYRQLFKDLYFSQGYRLWEATQSVVADLGKLPELRELHVLYGENVLTPVQFSYGRGAFPDNKPQIRRDRNGDGTVNRRSLEAFKKYPSTIFINVTHHAYPGMDHMGVLTDQRVLSFITNLVFSQEPPLPPRHEKSRSHKAARYVWGLLMLFLIWLGLLCTVIYFWCRERSIDCNTMLQNTRELTVFRSSP